MNERIRELAHVAGLPTYNPEGVPTKLEKFAELIVRECMRMCDVAAVGYETHGHNNIASGCDSAKEYIAEHFGVEE
jgi:hypothetical protein